MALSSVSKDFIVKHGLVVNTTATFLSTALTVSTNTGAVIVAGGVGIGGDLHVGPQVNINSSTGHQALTVGGALDFGHGSALVSPYTDNVAEFTPDANLGYSYLVLPAVHSSTGSLWVGQISANPNRIRTDTGANYQTANGIPFFTLGSKLSTELEADYPAGGIDQFERIPDNHTINWDVRGRVSINEATLDEAFNVLGSIKIQVASTESNVNGVVNSNWRPGRALAGDEGSVGIYFADGTFQYSAFNESSFASTSNVAIGALNLYVEGQASTSTYFPTFIEFHGTGPRNQTVYSTSSFSINPGTGSVSVNGDLNVGKVATINELTVTTYVTVLYGASLNTATIYSTENSYDPYSGAFNVAGGVGIAQDLHVGVGAFLNDFVSTGSARISHNGNVNPQYNLRIDSGDLGDKLAIRTSDTPGYGILQGVLTADESGYGPYKIAASEFHLFLNDNLGNTVQANVIEVNTSGQVLLTGKTVASSTYTGALVVSGGVGIGGDLYVGGNFYANGVPVLTTNTIAESFTGGVDIQVDISTSTGILTINDTSTLQSVTARGATTDRDISITAVTTSTDQSTGALVVSGGIAAGDLVNANGFYAYNNGEIGLHDEFSGNYVGFKSSATLTATTIWILPETDGKFGQFLSTDGEKKLSWSDPANSGYPPFPDGDYAEGEMYPGEVVLVDAFGVSLSEHYNCMDPEGVMLDIDLGHLA